MKNGFSKHCLATNLMSSLQKLDAKNPSHPSVYYIYYGSSYIINWQQLLPRSQHVVITVLRKPHRFTSASWCYCCSPLVTLRHRHHHVSQMMIWERLDPQMTWLKRKSRTLTHNCKVFFFPYLHGFPVVVLIEWLLPQALLTLDRFWVVLKKAFVWVV